LCDTQVDAALFNNNIDWIAIQSILLFTNTM